MKVKRFKVWKALFGYNRAIAMKKIRKIALKNVAHNSLILWICSFILYACIELYSFSEDDLYGTWIGNKGELNIIVSFSQDSTIELVFNKSGSKTNKIKGTFEVDFSKTPIPLSVRNIPNLTHPLHTIILFRGYNTIVMGGFGSRLKLRPITFKSDEIIIFTRSNNP
jgi:hypothetical protein